MPVRLQRKRTKGYRLPAGAIYVGRPSRWGNPFRVVRRGNSWWTIDDNDVEYDYWPTKVAAAHHAVNLFYGLSVRGEIDFDPAAAREALRGHDLACWCPLDQPCHADVLLELAAGGDC